MNLQWMGAILIIAGCGGVGFGMALSYKREEAALGKLIQALDFMRCELEYRLTPLPELCRKTAAYSGGSVGGVFADLARELETQVSPDAACCMAAVLKKARELPKRSAAALAELGKSLGRFDLEGQVMGMSSVKSVCQRELEELEANRSNRIRSYQTLGLCAGAALAILFI